MSFETATTYRSADRVHAVRLTAEGNIPITHGEDAWLRRLLADGRLRYADPGFYVSTYGSASRNYAAPQEWIAWHDRSDVAEAMSDAVFRERYEVLEEE